MGRGDAGSGWGTSHAGIGEGIDEGRGAGMGTSAGASTGEETRAGDGTGDEMTGGEDGTVWGAGIDESAGTGTCFPVTGAGEDGLLFFFAGVSALTWAQAFRRARRDFRRFALLDCWDSG